MIKEAVRPLCCINDWDQMKCLSSIQRMRLWRVCGS